MKKGLLPVEREQTRGSVPEGTPFRRRL
jgi:hypothetical protein